MLRYAGQSLGCSTLWPPHDLLEVFPHCLEFCSEEFHILGISGFLRSPVHLQFGLTVSCLSGSHHLTSQGIGNLEESFSDHTTVTFCMLVKLAPHEWCQDLPSFTTCQIKQCHNTYITDKCWADLTCLCHTNSSGTNNFSFLQIHKIEARHKCIFFQSTASVLSNSNASGVLIVSLNLLGPAFSVHTSHSGLLRSNQNLPADSAHSALGFH